MKFIKTFTAISVATVLTACFHSSDEDDTNTVAAKYHAYIVDHGGNINIVADDGGSNVAFLTSIQPKNSKSEALGLGEVHFNQGKAFVIVQSNMTNSAGDVVGGGVIVVDLATQTVDATVPFESTKTNNISRIVHTYVDPNGNYIWFNNDGPSGNADADSVFRMNWNTEDNDATDGDKYLDFTEIALGNGHKKGAFSFNDETITDSVTVPLYFASHNLSDQSVSLIDNDPTSSTFLEVTTVDFGPVTVGDATLQNTPHGLEFSPLSGKFYIGITPGQDMAVAVIDTNNIPANADAVRAASISAGTDVQNKEIPGGGYIHSSKDHKFLYMVGKKDGVGYLSVVDPTNDSVVDVIDLGNISSSSFVYAHGHMDHDGMEMAINKVYVGASSATDYLDNVIKVVTIDPETGGMKAGTTVASITTNIGKGTRHRNGKGTSDGMHVYMPNGGGECTDHENMDPDCSTVSVINTMTDTVLSKVHMTGHMPGSMGIVDVQDLNLMFTAVAADGHEHSHN